MPTAKYIEFRDASGQRYRYMYPDVGRTRKPAGWLCVLMEDGWYPVRKATNKDIAEINKAVVKAHHQLN
jgi:hypothetical protein